MPVLSEWQEGRGQREREPPRLTYERSLLAERLGGPCSHPARRHVGAEPAEESSAGRRCGRGGCSIISLSGAVVGSAPAHYPLPLSGMLSSLNESFLFRSLSLSLGLNSLFQNTRM